MDSDLSGKNIILISPKYFNYEKEIQNELEKRGAFVYFIDDRIKNNTLNKALFRLKLKEKIGKNKVIDYFKSHLENNRDRKVDYLIAIIPEGFSKEIIQYYKTQLKDTIFILYMWDSIDNRPYIIETLGFYERALTFDKNNADKYGLEFRPLFYTKSYKEIGLRKENCKYFKYDLSFIGTAHSDRYSVIKKFVHGSNNKLKTFFFFYLQNPILIVYYWIIDPMFRKVKIKDISFISLPQKEVLSVIENSFCIVDINHPKQSGLTIRTIEVLGAKRKLVTTNRDILDYDFYDSENILLIDRNNPIFDGAFFEKPYKEINKEIYNKYSLSQWIDDVLLIRNK
ncbi:MAG: hypothetical protein JWR05_3213 [Mucilaginibacter sp.]|nr:hypothetical protein [Mucilaginibacter sp.]